MLLVFGFNVWLVYGILLIYFKLKKNDIGYE